MLAVLNALDKLQADTGLDIPIHVDGASGAGLCKRPAGPNVIWVLTAC